MGTNTKVLTPTRLKMSHTKDLATYSKQKQIRHYTASAEQVDHARRIHNSYLLSLSLIDQWTTALNPQSTKSKLKSNLCLEFKFPISNSSARLLLQLIKQCKVEITTIIAV